MFHDTLHNFFPLISALIAMLSSQSIKLLIFLKNKNYTFSKGSFISAGGMPSTHSALITAISISIGLKNGFNSTDFFLAITLLLIIIYDARGIRQSVGNHAKILNKKLLNDHEKTNEYIGHSTSEVIVGILVGLVVAILMFNILNI